VSPARPAGAAGLDLLAGNAVIDKQVLLLHMSLAGQDAVIRASRLTGAFLPIRKAGTITTDGGGVIVTMSSVHELIPWPGFAR
jgi:glucose 1-dehydrogenase